MSNGVVLETGFNVGGLEMKFLLCLALLAAISSSSTQVLAQLPEKPIAQIKTLEVMSEKPKGRARREALKILASLRQALQKGESEKVDIWSLFRPNFKGIRIR